MASVAWLSAVPGARLKEIVTAGNCPWWLIDSGCVGSVVQCASAESGTSPPVTGEWRYSLDRESTLPWSSGRISRMT